MILFLLVYNILAAYFYRFKYVLNLPVFIYFHTQWPVWHCIKFGSIVYVQFFIVFFRH